MLHHPRTRDARRRGIATLELVFIFPLLMLMSTAIFMMFRGDVGKESTATRARAQAFRQKDSADPGRILLVDRNPLDSVTSTLQSQPVALGPLFGRSATEARSAASVEGRVWDYADIAFASIGQTWRPHQTELWLMAANGGFPPGITPAALDSFSRTLNPDINPGLYGLAFAGRVLNVPVRLSGRILESPVSSVVRTVQAIVRAAAAIARRTVAGQQRAADLDKFADFLQVGLDSFHNLFEASRGRPGNWDLQLIQELKRTFP